jgi:hypothetical protein
VLYPTQLGFDDRYIGTTVLTDRALSEMGAPFWLFWTEGRTVDDITPKPADITVPDMSFLRDFVDIIKNKMLFFFPFYGAFLALLFSKSDYVLQASFIVWILCAATFFAGIFYAYQVSQTLWALEHVRVIAALNKLNGGGLFSSMSDDTKIVYNEVLKKLMPLVSFEDKIFRRTMFLIYMTAIAVLIDIYFGKLISAGTTSLTRRILSHL